MEHNTHLKQSRSRQAATNNISLSFGARRKRSRVEKHDALLTFMAHTRKLQYRPAPSTLSFLRTILSLFI